jgi:hypothetical protein
LISEFERPSRAPVGFPAAVRDGRASFEDDSNTMTLGDHTMQKRFAQFAAPVVSTLILIAGCDSGGVSEGIPQDAKSGEAPVLPGGLMSTKDIAKKGSAAPSMPGGMGTPAPK